MKRTPRHVTNPKDIQDLVNLKEDDITTSLIMEYFAEFDGKPRFDPYDEVDIPANSYGPSNNRNQNKFHTTVGIWIFNKYFIEKDLFHIFGYISKTISKKSLKNLQSILTYALIEDKISLDIYKRYMMKTQKCMPYISILSPSYSYDILTCSKLIGKKKEELIKKYADRIKAGDEMAADAMEDELKKYAKDLLGDDPAMDSFNSGARGSFDNNFKNMYIMKGAMKDPDPNKGYNIATSNYMDGISKEEYAMFANSLAAGPYARGKKTEIGGYWEKLFLSAYQHIVLEPQGSDCGTKRTLKVLLTKDIADLFMYSYIVEGTKFVELTSDNLSKYIGKEVKFRFSSLCESKKGICSKCAGNFFYRIGVKNVGMSTPIVASKLKNLSMKSFHDSSLSFVEMDPMKAFGIK